jgi:hypothetical protein
LVVGDPERRGELRNLDRLHQEAGSAGLPVASLELG